MAPETIALASVISSGTVGLAAVVGTWLGGWRGRVHDRKLRREDRRQQRVEQAYDALVAYVEKRIRIAARIRPVMTFENDPPTPTISDEEVDRAQALVDLHASPEVDRLLDEFADKLRLIDNTEIALRMNDDARKTRREQLDPKDFGFPDWVEPQMFVSLNGIKELREIKDRLRQQMRRELNPGTKVPALDPSKEPAGRRRRWPLLPGGDPERGS